MAAPRDMLYAACRCRMIGPAAAPASPPAGIDARARGARRAAAVAAVALALLAGCARDREARTAADAAALDGPFAPRRIPVIVRVLSGPGAPNPTDEADVFGAVAYANETFVDSGVTFYTHAVLRHELRVLHHSDDVGPLYSWAEVRDDVARVDPAMATAQFDPAARASSTVWAGQIAARQPPDAVTVFVFTSVTHDGKRWGSNCASPFPHNDGDPFHPPPRAAGFSRDGSKGIFCTPGAVAGRRIHALPHELGHNLGGLFHTFDVMNKEALAREGVTPADYYDLVYAPTPRGDGIMTFHSKAEALPWARSLRALDSNVERDDGGDSRFVVPGPGCNTQFRFLVPRGIVVLDAARDTDNLMGMVFRPRPGWDRYGFNVMSYLYVDPVKTPCDMRFSRSQIAMIQRKLRSSPGQRNLLGTIPRAALDR